MRKTIKNSKGKRKRADLFFQLPVIGGIKPDDVAKAAAEMQTEPSFDYPWGKFTGENEAYLSGQGHRLPLHEVKTLCAFFMGIGVGRRINAEEKARKEWGCKAYTIQFPR